MIPNDPTGEGRDTAAQPMEAGEAERAAERLRARRNAAPSSRVASHSRGSMSTGRWMWEGIKAVSTAIVLFLLIRTFVVEAFKIPTGSMENTLLVGDFLLVNKAVYGAEIPIASARLPGFAEPSREDVVVFLPPHDPDKNYVKRIVGMPGDTLEMREKILFVNGEPREEPYVRYVDRFSDPVDTRMMWQVDYLLPGEEPGYYQPSRDTWGPIVVPAGKYFALGDNRDNSEDSRYWGFLDASDIKGRPMFVYYSFVRNPLEPLSWLTHVRWSRIGDVIR